MNVLSKILVAIIPVVMIAGCSTQDTKMSDTESSDESHASMGSSSSAPAHHESDSAVTSAVTSAVSSDSGFSGSALDNPSSLLSKRVIYFDFDKSDIDSASRDIISAHAAYLSDNPGASVVLEGHADERGTREYNIGLGERRYKAVARLMALQGTLSRQVEGVSYGEERPVAMGSDDSSWRLNRRVEIVYQGR